MERSRITKGLNADEIFSGINDHFTAQDLVNTSAQWQLGVTPDEWTAVFNHLDVDGFGSVSRSELIKYVGSKRYHEAQLEAKVVGHVQNLRPGTAQALFEAEDTQGSRRVTREQFKLVLKQLGFKLFEEPDRPALLQVPDPRYGRGALASSPLGADSPLDLRRETEVLDPEYEQAKRARKDFEERVKLIAESRDLGDAGFGASGIASTDGAGLAGPMADDIGVSVTMNADTSRMDLHMSRSSVEGAGLGNMAGARSDAEVFELVRRRIVEVAQVSGGDASPELWRVFQDIDTDQSGFVDHREWMAAWTGNGDLRALTGLDGTRGVLVNDEEVERLFHYYDRNGDGRISYTEFLTALVGPAPKPVRAEAPTLIVETPDATMPFDELAGGLHADPGVVGQPGKVVALSVAEVEAAIFEIFRERSGKQQRPDLRADFTKLDQLAGGVVSRKQFAHVCTQYFRDALPNHHRINQLWEFFGVDGSPGAVDAAVRGQSVLRAPGHSVDWRAFVVFCDYTEPDTGAGVEAIRHMMLHEGTKEMFASRDQGGNRVVTNEDFIEVLKKLGYDYLTTDKLDAIIRLFEAAEAGYGYGSGGFVDYVAFVDFGMEQGTSLKLRRLEHAIRAQLTERRAVTGKVQDLKAALQAVDSVGAGKLKHDRFEETLEALGVHLTDSDLSLLYERIDPRDNGVAVVPFADMIDNPYPTGAAIGVLKEADRRRLQRRAVRVMEDASARKGGDDSAAKAELKKCFTHYDWRKLGVVGVAEFGTALLRFGFPFTRAECRALADEMAVDHIFENPHLSADGPMVFYQKFIDWALAGATLKDEADYNPNPKRAIGAGADRQVEELLDMVGDELKRARVTSADALSIFEAMDIQFRGGLDEPTFIDGLQRLLPRQGRCARLTDEELLSMATPFLRPNRQGGQLVRYRDFLRRLDPQMPVGAAQLEGEQHLLQVVRSRFLRLARPGDGGLWRPFQEIDQDSSGFVDKRELLRALEALGLELQPNEVRLIFDKFDTNNDGRIGYAEFLRFLEAGHPELGQQQQLATGLMTPIAVSSTAGPTTIKGAIRSEALERLREIVRKCIARGINYRAVFEKADEEHTGSMSSADLAVSLRALNASLTEVEVQDLEVAFQGAKPGEVRYLEMLHTVAPGRAGYGEIWRHEERLRQLIKKKFQWWKPGKLKKAFRHFDVHRKNKITEQDFSNGLKPLGFRLSAAQEHQVFQLLDLDGDGAVTYADLVVFVRDANHHHVAQRLRYALNQNDVNASNVKRVLDGFDTNGPLRPIPRPPRNRHPTIAPLPYVSTSPPHLATTSPPHRPTSLPPRQGPSWWASTTSRRRWPCSAAPTTASRVTRPSASCCASTRTRMATSPPRAS